MPPVTEVPEKLRKTRKECSYTAAERAILAKHKEAYLATTSHHERDRLLRGEVFIDMFNYWFDGDKVVMTEEEIVEKQKVRSNKISHGFSISICPQELCQWIRNNWRLKRSVKIDAARKKPSRIQVVRHLRREEVEDEIKRLHEAAGNEGEPTAKERFALGATAAKNVYAALDRTEQANVTAAINRAAAEGNPPDIQRR